MKLKQKMVNAAKHSAYNHEEARWMNRQRIKDNADNSKRKLSKRELEDMMYEEAEEDYDQQLEFDFNE